MSDRTEGRIPKIRSHVAYHLITNYGGICSNVHTGKFAAYSMLSSKIIRDHSSIDIFAVVLYCIYVIASC
jgi:hypothetical protein